MPSLSNTSSPPDLVFSQPTFRSVVRPQDIDAVEQLVRNAGVFNKEEICIACDLVRDNLRIGATASGYHFLFADGAAGLNGYVCFGPIAGTVKRFELYWIAVDERTRRMRLGQQLQSATESAARAAGAVLLIAETSTRGAYTAARSFYQAQSYKSLAVVPDWYDDGDGLVIFSKRL